jgi:flagellar biogenesis protein FliO
VLIENKYAAIAAVAAFLFLLWFTDGSLIAAFGGLALIAGLGWAVRRLFSNRA